MADIQKDLEALRKAVDEVSSQISAIVFLRTALTIVLAVLLIRALNSNSRTIQHDIAEVGDLSRKYNLELPQLDPLTLLFSGPRQFPDRRFPQETDLERQKDNAQDKIDADILKIQNEYWSVFAVEFALLGTKIQFDLRVILLMLPLIGPLANVYQVALRHKRRHLIALGEHRLRELPEGEALTIDSVAFRDSLQSWVYKYPISILNAAFWASAATLIVVCGIFEANLAVDDRRWGLVLMNVTIAAFLGAMNWGRNINYRIGREVLTQTGVRVPPNEFDGRVTALRNSLLRGASHFRPASVTALGSLLILSTLGLNIGASFPGARYPFGPEKGYLVVLGKALYAPLEFWDIILGGVTRVMYVGLLILSLGALLTSWIGKWHSAAIAWFATVTAIFFLFFLARNASQYFLPIHLYFLYWLCATVRFVYLILMVRTGKRTREDCESTILATSEPLLPPIICVLTIYGAVFPGLPVMTLGVALLMTGAYARLIRAQAAAQAGAGPVSGVLTLDSREPKGDER